VRSIAIEHGREQADIGTLAQLSRAEVSFAGGNGANLGELTRAGLPVPPGRDLAGSAGLLRRPGFELWIMVRGSLLEPLDRTRRLVAAAEQRLLLTAARDGGAAHG